MHIYIYKYIYICIYIYIYSSLHFEVHFFNFESQSIICFLGLPWNSLLNRDK